MVKLSKAITRVVQASKRRRRRKGKKTVTKLIQKWIVLLTMILSSWSLQMRPISTRHLRSHCPRRRGEAEFAYAHLLRLTNHDLHICAYIAHTSIANTTNQTRLH